MVHLRAFRKLARTNTGAHFERAFKHGPNLMAKGGPVAVVVGANFGKLRQHCRGVVNANELRQRDLVVHRISPKWPFSISSTSTDQMSVPGRSVILSPSINLASAKPAIVQATDTSRMNQRPLSASRIR